jgi:hypothetical protein
MSVDIDRTISLAKSGLYSRSQVYGAMEMIANERRRPGESLAQSFSRFVMTDEGGEMLRIQRSMEGRDIEPSAFITKAAPASEWDNLVAKIRQSAKCSESTAVNAAMETEAGRFAFSMKKRQDRIATGQFTVADMQCLDGAARASETQWQDISKRTSYHPYEMAVEHARQAYGLSESKAHDHVRAKDPDLWERYKKLNKLGANVGTLPQPHPNQESDADNPPTPTSGREGRAPAQWTGGNTTITPTTPEHEKEHPSETPTVKQEHEYFKHGYISKGDLAAFTREVRGRRFRPHPGGGTEIW